MALIEPHCLIIYLFRDRQLPLRTYFLLLLIPVWAALLVCAVSVYSTYFTDDRMARARAIFTPDEAPYIISYNGVEDAVKTAIPNLVSFVCDVAAYVAIVYYGLRTWLHVRRAIALAGGAAVNRDVNRQLFAVLLFQAMTPLLLGVLLGVYTEAATLTTAGSTNASFSAQSPLSLSLNWMPVANGLFALGVIRPYRQTALGALSCRRCAYVTRKPSTASTLRVAAVTSTNLDGFQQRITIV